jgi:cytoskeletal protein CcmA (bactofilin family)
MFGNRKRIKTTKIDTLIGRKSEMLGDVRFTGGLHVDGTIKGNIVAGEDASSLLTLSESGIVEGDVRVPNVVLNGTVIGDVHAKQHIELASNARITGNVYYSLIEMAMGAEVNGNLVHVAEDLEVPLQLGHEARFGMVEET